MMGLPLAFSAPAVLVALAALPVIWWLLRMTPPRPRAETFPPTRLLLEIARKDETPARSPWWMTVLRLLLAALLIIALAGPIFRPSGETVPGTGPLLLVVDNGWASADRWEGTRDTARRILALAAAQDRPVSLVATAEGPGQAMQPGDPGDLQARLEALEPQPHATDRAGLLAALAPVAADAAFGGVAWLSDDLGGPDAEAFAAFLGANVKAPVEVYSDANGQTLGLKPPSNAGDAMTVPVLRRNANAAGAGQVEAHDIQGRVIGEATFDFGIGEPEATATFDMPSELRNEIVRLEITGERSAGAVQLLDERYRRRTIGIVSGGTADVAQPLLSPDYFLSRAVLPFADIRQPKDPSAASAIPEMIESGISVIMLADVGTLPADVEEQLTAWIEKGGTLIRFAGPRLAASEDTLTPVRLREGGRTLGGSLSWETPQPLGAFPDTGPFSGLTVPDDVLVKRQVLAEPDGALAGHVWATLADGTPLVTAAPMGRGSLVLFHVTADTNWSNLPLSGTFVEMLRRIIALSHAAAGAREDPNGRPAVLPPFRVLDGYGRFTAPGASVEPVPANADSSLVGPSHPPGLYGAEDGFLALNLLAADATLPPFDPATVTGASVRPYPTSSPTELGPYLLAAALGLLLLDALAVLWLSGGLRSGRRAATTAAGLVLAAGLAAGIATPHPASAQDFRLPGDFQPAEVVRPDNLDEADLRALDATSKTELAYVVTGDDDSDRISREGLVGLSRVLADRTALEPGDPVGVDISKDELAFFPLLYWRVTPNAPLPSTETIARIDAYMKSGGSILFDTADQLESATLGPAFQGTPSGDHLRDMLATLDLPPLEPVPADHVLTKAFYLLSDFPGRYTGGDLWVEALPEESEVPEDRPARPGDGVTPILITSNDFASAWAVDDVGNFLYPTIPASRRQREMAFRVGVNIVMYTLTGNYKADQVHVPALLERLGQ